MKLDAGRLSVFSPAELSQIAIGAIEAVEEQFAVLDRALAAPDPVRAREAAHRARNEALLVGARELSEALDAIERALDERQLAAARDAMMRARALWPPTRDAIVAVGDQGVTG
jgi:HPt (histidine-containing phosphotransfer) domain-containing protein